MVYGAKVSTKDNIKPYYVTCEWEFQSRFYNHMKSFRDRGNGTELFKLHLATEGRIQHMLENIYVCNTL